jgi:O-antigen/teichoic acid export membrane protein
LLVLSPVLFPKIAKAFAGENAWTGIHERGSLSLLIRAEMMIAVFVALVMNISCKSFVNLVSGDKYAASAPPLVFILSCCMPLLYLNNILWSINFAKGKMRIILSCIVITLSVNIAADLLLIPLFSAKGAAFGFVTATLVQTVFYALRTDPHKAKMIFPQVILICIIGLTAGFLARYLVADITLQLAAACTGYFIVLAATGQLRLRDWTLFKKITAV